MASNTIDFETERLVIEIQREDLREAIRSTHDTLRIALIRDQYAALKVQSQEVQLRENRHAEQVLQQSMYAAMLSDSCAVAEERHHEQQAVEDRVMAAQLAGRPPPAIAGPVRKQIAGGQFEDARLTQLEEIMPGRDVETEENRNEQNGALNGIGNGQAHSDTKSVNLERYMAVMSLDEGRPAVECVVCLNNLLASQTMTLTCGDVWCRDCLTRLFQDATLNEGVWPPKCCRQEIPANNLQHILSTDLRNRFDRKSIEWSTIDRVYCLEPTCSEFIPSEFIEGRKAECPACHRNTCSECKSAYHENPPCSETTAKDEVLREMARTNGWQNCPSCHRFVEITHGCNHMTCFCRTQFCYECAALWKQCRCPQWRDDRLLARATEVAERQGRQNVARVVQELIARHECDHVDFTRVGGGTCDECGHDLRDFLNRYDGYHLETCNRYRYGRI